MSGFRTDATGIRRYAGTVAVAGDNFVTTGGQMLDPGLRAAGFGRVAQGTAGAAYETAVGHLQNAVTSGGDTLHQTSDALNSAATTYEQDDQASSQSFDRSREAM